MSTERERTKAKLSQDERHRAFGSFKESGLRRENGFHAIEDTETKTVWADLGNTVTDQFDPRARGTYGAQILDWAAAMTLPLTNPASSPSHGGRVSDHLASSRI